MSTKWLRFYLIATIVMTVLLIASTTARTYSGGGASGLAWNWGGIEFQGDPGIFLCPGNFDPASGTYTQYPWADLFPQLITDC